MVRRFLATVLLVLVPSGIYAQDAVKHLVKGVILEDGHKEKVPLSFSNIFVTDADGAMAAKAATFDDGTFSFHLADGKYKMLVENTGHKSRILPLTVSGKDLALGNIYLKVGEEIAAASIEGETLIKRSGTRVIYDVSKDPDADKIDMSKMIAKIPEIRMSAQNGMLKYDDLPFSDIYIDNDKHGLINERRQYPMEFIKANHMKQVELVLPGDLEYNNKMPILLIKLAKPLPYGFAGNLEDRSSTKNEHSPSADAVIHTPFIGIGLGYQYSHAGPPELTDKRIMEITDDSSFERRIEGNESSGHKSNTHSIHTDLFRSFANNRINFGASLKGNFAESSSFRESSTIINYSDGTKQEDNNRVESISKSPFRLNASVKINGDFGKMVGKRNKRRKNEWRLEYSYNDTYHETDESYPSYSKLSTNEAKEHRATGVLNLRDPINKPILSGVSIRAGYYDRYYDILSTCPTDTNGLQYHQQVPFLDVTALGSIFNKKLGYTLKFVGEYLSNEGSFLNGSVRSPLDYGSFNINPMVGLGWHIKRGMLSALYSKSVSRPKVDQLNPYEDRSDPYHIRTGNPFLKGSNTNSFVVIFRYMPAPKWFREYGVSASFFRTTDLISRVVTLLDNGISKISYENIGQEDGYSITANSSFRIAPSLNIWAYATLGQSFYVLPSGMNNSVISPSGRVRISWDPDYFNTDVSFDLRPSSTSIQTSKIIYEPSINASISRYFEGPHLGISLSVQDVLHKGGVVESFIHYDGFTQHDFRERLGRCYRLTVYWRFGRFEETGTKVEKAYDM